MSIADLVFVDSSGFNAPDFPTLDERFKDQYRGIYGPDVYLAADSQDGQWVSIQAKTQFDAVQILQAIYNSFSPKTAQGDALTKNVAINGIIRSSPTFSQVDLDIVGQAGTVINDGQAEDTIGQKWDLPAIVAIPLSGTITVTALADKEGAIIALADTITKIATPTNGWQTVNNPLPSIDGEPVQTDAQLSLQQQNSTMIPSLSVLDGIIGSVNSLPGVVKIRGYENDKSTTNVVGIPANSIALVVEGGIAQDIGDQIGVQKTLGTPTFGSTSVITTDSVGVTNEIFFSRPIPAEIGVQITINPEAGYVATTSADIKAEVVKYIDSLLIGENIDVSRLYTPAYLNNDLESFTYNILSIEANKNGGAFSNFKVLLDFDEGPESNLLIVEVILD